MDLDLDAIRTRFAEMSREALLEELALRVGDYLPQARLHLEAEGRRRGITPEEIARFSEGEGEACEDWSEGCGCGVGVESVTVAFFRPGDAALEEAAALLKANGIPFVVKGDTIYDGQGRVAGEGAALNVPFALAKKAGFLIDQFMPSTPGDEAAEGEGFLGAPPDGRESR
jgi:hypothetical protein